MAADLIKQIRELLFRSKTDKAIENILLLDQKFSWSTKTQFGNLKATKRKGEISESEYSTRLNQLHNNILDWLSEFEEAQIVLQPSSDQKNGLEEGNVEATLFDNKLETITDIFIQQLEEFLRKHPTHLSQPNTMELFSYVYLEERIRFYDQQIKYIEQLNRNAANFEVKLANIVNDLKDDLQELLQVLKKSGNDKTPIHELTNEALKQTRVVKRELLKVMTHGRSDGYQLIEIELPNLLLPLEELLAHLAKKMQVISN